MIRNSEPIRKSVVYAAVAASLLMLVFGWSYRVLAARLARPSDVTPITPAAVEKFPMQIGDWTGQDVVIDADVVRATDTDAHISRRYSRRSGLDVVSLYVACGVRARDLMPHRPEVCYTGAGWTVTGHSTIDLSLSDGGGLPCSVFQFSRGALSVEKVLVLYYYLVDGQYCQDVSLLRSKAWQGSGLVGYVAQVQVITPIAATVDADASRALIAAFAAESAPAIAELFKNQPTAQTSHDPLKQQ